MAAASAVDGADLGMTEIPHRSGSIEMMIDCGLQRRLTVSVKTRTQTGDSMAELYASLEGVTITVV